MSATAVAVRQAPREKVKKHSEFAVVMKRLAKNKLAMVGLFVIILLVFVAVFAPLISPYGYEELNPANAFASPSAEHWFGTDSLGRDIFSRILYGARYSLSAGVLATALGMAVGTVFGSIAGYFGGMVDTVLMRCIDIIQAVPGILLAIAVSTALGAGFGNTILALSIGGISMNTRLLRATILGIRNQEYLEAATSINCSKGHIILHHILPNSFSPLIVSATMSIGNMILSAASLSYIGLGIQPPLPEWGAMLSAGRNYIRDYSHLVIFPGLFIMITVLSFNMLGDGLRDALDPKLKQ